MGIVFFSIALYLKVLRYSKFKQRVTSKTLRPRLEDNRDAGFVCWLASNLVHIDS